MKLGFKDVHDWSSLDMMSAVCHHEYGVLFNGKVHSNTKIHSPVIIVVLQMLRICQGCGIRWLKLIETLISTHLYCSSSIHNQTYCI